MKKCFVLFALPLIALSACTKNAQTACGTQVCTKNFASIIVQFVDKDKQPVQAGNFAILDLRTNKRLYSTLSATANMLPGAMIVADDGNLMELSTDGDDIRVTATNPNTNETLNTNFKIAGGCGCHVSKISGPDTIKFN